MTTQPITLAADLLDRIAGGADSAELDRSLAALRASAGTDAHPSAVERLHAQLSALVHTPLESGLTERSLNLLIETTHDLSRTLSLQDLLRKIVSRARGLVGAHVAWLSMLDEEAGLFRTLTTEGNLLARTAGMTSEKDRGAVSLVMATKSYFATQDYLNDTRFTHSPDLDRSFADEKIVSLAGFPILADDRVQGLLFVADRYSRQYSGREISVLGSFAVHAGVAMRNARSFAQLSEALAETERNRRSLEDHLHRVEGSARTHDVMMSLLAQGADLLTFMQRMAGLVDGGIQYLDAGLGLREEVVAKTYRGGLMDALRAGAVDRAAILSAIAQSRKTGRSALILDTGEERCFALALHGGTTRGDSLIVCHEGPIDEIPMRNLERSAVALSIATLWTEKRETERQIASSTLLRHLALVSRPDAPTIASARDRLGLSAGQPVRMALLVLSGRDRLAQTELVREAGARRNLLVDLIDDASLAIGPEKEVTALIEAIRRRAGTGRHGGLISDPFADLTETPRHYARMGTALRTMQKIAPLNRVLQEREVTLFARIFEDSDPARITEFVARTLAPITARDTKGRAQLKATLLRYFECQFNLSRAAEEMGVHVNTVRQRLETLRDVTGGWDDPVTALELQMALRLETLLEG
ncbi:helix-turn-helix domain-containing protein [Pseudooceanicola sp.]|uniref:helix-turn-helix domain-containing protein n=1 Tax=Pseudooceanicola sp. TaxID=1914328 RepID=UPI00405863DA